MRSLVVVPKRKEMGGQPENRAGDRQEKIKVLQEKRDGGTDLGNK